MSEQNKIPENQAGDADQISDEQLEQVAGGTGCIYIPPPFDPDDRYPQPTIEPIFKPIFDQIR